MSQIDVTEENSDSLDHDLLMERQSRFEKSRIFFISLVLVALPAVNFYIGQFVPEETLQTWNIAFVPAMFVLLFTAFSPYTTSRRTNLGLPRFYMPASVLVAAVLGCIGFLDTVEPQQEYLSVVVAASLGAIAAVLILFSVIRPLATAMVYAIVIPLFVSAFVHEGVQANFIGVATLGAVFGLYMPYMQTQSLTELLRLKKLAQVEADEANRRSHHDHLTGLLNRLGITETFKDLDSSHVTGLFFLDLDRFKDVNDRLGHELGDKVLVEVGARLRRELDGIGAVARLGGDEFLVAITEDIDQHDLARDVIAALEEPFKIDAEEIHISASVGISTVDSPDLMNLSDLMRRSDYALYQAKSTGRGQAVTFSNDLADDRMEAATMREELRKAARSGAIEMWGQPIYDLATGEVQSVELLARWRKPNGEMVSPDQFIPIAEEMGTIDPITSLAVDEFVRCEKLWREDPVLSKAKVAINVSPRSFERGQITAQIAQACMDTGADPQRLVVEITEGLVFERVKESMAELVELRNMGITIALDDFGTGFSSMKRFFEMPISEVKIDKSLVDGITQSAQKQMMTRAIVSMANSLQRIIIAEGIETEEQLDAVASLGVSHGQGYLLCRPTPLDEIEGRAAGYFGRHAPRIAAGPEKPKLTPEESKKLVESFIKE